MSGANLKVRVIRATGHGPHGLLPKESAFCVIEIPGGTPTSAVTKEGHMEKAAVCWDEELQFQLSSDSKDVKVALLGQLPTNAGTADVCDLHLPIGRWPSRLHPPPPVDIAMPAKVPTTGCAHTSASSKQTCLLPPPTPSPALMGAARRKLPCAFSHLTAYICTQLETRAGRSTGASLMSTVDGRAQIFGPPSTLRAAVNPYDEFYAGDLIGHGSCNLTGLFGGLKDAHHQVGAVPDVCNHRQEISRRFGPWTYLYLLHFIWPCMQHTHALPS